MRSLRYVAITTTLASAIIFAQSQTTPAKPTSPAPSGQAASSAATTGTPMTGYARTYNATVVSAECSQASILASSGSYADRATSSASTETAAAASSNKENKSVYDKQREVLKHCRANDKSTAFAVVTDDGSFYKLDEAGNSQVTSAAGSDKEKKKNLKNMRVTVTGTPQGDTLKVQSLSKTDKPFGSA